MSEDAVSIMMDRERTLRFRFADFRELRRRLEGLSTQELLNRLGELDSEVLLQVVHVGLRHQEPKMRIERAEELIQITMDHHGGIKPLLQAVIDALLASGMMGDRNKGNAESPAND